MKKQQPNSPKKVTHTTSKYLCPRCRSRYMRKATKTPGGRQRWTCRDGDGDRDTCYTTTNPELPYVNTQSGKPAAGSKSPQFTRALGGIKRFVITSAQNATPVNQPFLSALKAYCTYNGAELVVIPIRYKNPTSRWLESQANAEWWDPRLAKLLYNQRKKLNDNLVLLGDIKTRPTAERPLTGFETITHAESGVLGHSKLQLMTIPTPHGRLPKIMVTTGSCTQMNYTDSKAGKKGEFHHVFGAAVVDIDGSKFHLRQINATRGGSFIDLDREYFPNASVKLEREFVRGNIPAGYTRKANPALALVMGDTHVRFIDPDVVKATFGAKGIIDRVRPAKLVWHDLLDGYARNPHHTHNPFIEVAKRTAGLHLVAREVEDTIRFLRKYSAGKQSIVVSSNHGDFFRRWIIDTDWRKDAANAEIYLQTALMMVRSACMGPGGAEYADPFKYWAEKRITKKDDIRILHTDESCVIGDVECGFHGHRGPNGARGTVNNLAKIGTRIISGHGHSPAIEKGHYRVGTSTRLKLEYTEGPSSWLNTHCIVYANGKRSLINIIHGKPFL